MLKLLRARLDPFDQRRVPHLPANSWPARDNKQIHSRTLVQPEIWEHFQPAPGYDQVVRLRDSKNIERRLLQTLCGHDCIRHAENLEGASEVQNFHLVKKQDAQAYWEGAHERAFFPKESGRGSALRALNATSSALR